MDPTANYPAIPTYEHQCTECFHIWSRTAVAPDVFCPQCNGHNINWQKRGPS